MPVLPEDLEKLISDASSKLESNLKLEQQRNTNRMSILSEISRNSTTIPTQNGLNISIYDIAVRNDGSYEIAQDEEIEKTLEKEGITIHDLVDCLLQDNHHALETYLQSIPTLQRDKIRCHVHTFNTHEKIGAKFGNSSTKLCTKREYLQWMKQQKTFPLIELFLISTREILHKTSQQKILTACNVTGYPHIPLLLISLKM